MPKGTNAREYRKKSTEELVGELRKLREELQSIRFTKVSGTAVAKLSKIKVRKFNPRSSENKSPES
jgi:ribosomal protein L29